MASVQCSRRLTDGRSECRPCVSGATPRSVRRASSHAGNPGLVPAHFQGLSSKLYRAMSDEVTEYSYREESMLLRREEMGVRRLPTASD